MNEEKFASIIAWDHHELPIYGYLLSYYGLADTYKISCIANYLVKQTNAAYVEVTYDIKEKIS